MPFALKWSFVNPFGHTGYVPLILLSACSSSSTTPEPASSLSSGSFIPSVSIALMKMSAVVLVLERRLRIESTRNVEMVGVVVIAQLSISTD